MYVTDKPVNNNSIGGEGRSERKGAVVVESLADDQGPPDSSFIRIKISHLCVCIYIYISLYVPLSRTWREEDFCHYRDIEGPWNNIVE